MKNKIILFDIDRTLFDTQTFLKDFDSEISFKIDINLNELDEIKNLYDEIKVDFGYFLYPEYIKRIYKKYPSLKNKLDYFFEKDNINKYLFPDSKVLFELKDIRRGIFSEGDLKFQRSKIDKFESVIEKDLIYIFQDKIKKLPEVLNKHSDSEIYIVDDRIDIHIESKKLSQDVRTILIKREGDNEDINEIDFRIKSLFDIMPILK